jgi:predicted PurR-regulated permease PerM
MPTSQEDGLAARRRLIEAALVLLAVGLPLALTITALSPFLGAFVWATVLAVSGWPLAQRLLPWVDGNRTRAALAVAVFYVVVLALPLLYLSATLTQAIDQGIAALAAGLQAGLPAPPGFLAHIPLLGPRLAALWQQDTADIAGTLGRSEGTLVLLGQAMLRGLSDLAGALGELAFGILLAFQLLAAGPRVAALLRRLALRLGGPAGEEALAVSQRAILAVAQGVIGSALAEAIACGVAFWLCGLPVPSLLALACFVLRLLQIGTLPVWLAAAFWLWWTSAWWTLLLLLVPLCLLVGWAAARLERRLVGPRLAVPRPLLFLAVLGGLLAWGFTGMFTGAVAVTIAWTLLLRWLAEGDEAARPRHNGGKEDLP